MIDFNKIEATPEGLKQALIELREDFFAHNHDGNNSKSFETIRAEDVLSRILISGTPGGARGELASKVLKFFNANNIVQIKLSADGIDFFTSAGAVAATIGFSASLGLYIQDSNNTTPLYINADTYIMRKFKPYIDDNTIDIGATTTGHRFRTIYLINNPDVSSSREGKDNIKNIHYGLKALMKLRPVSFSRKTHDLVDGKKKERDEQNLGFIAEEIQEVLPEISDGKSYRPGDMIPLLVKAIQELTDRVEALKKK